MFYSIFLAILLSIIAISFPKSRFICILFTIYMWVLWGWNTYNGDYEAYEQMYILTERNVFFPIEPGYRLLMEISNELGLDYRQFLIFISFVSLALISLVIILLSSYPAFNILIYFWFFFPLDYVLIRNTLAFFIVALGIVLILRDIKYKYLYFITLVLISTSIHLTCIFYLSFLGIFLFKKINNSTLIVIVLLSLLSLYLIQGLFQSALSLGFEERSTTYSGSINSAIYNLFWQTLIIITLYKTFIYAKKRCGSHTINDILLIYRCNFLLYLLFPLYLIVAISVRIFRNLSFIDLIFINDNILNKRTPWRYSLLIIPVIWFLYNHFINPVSFDTIVSLFSYNKILGLL